MLSSIQHIQILYVLTIIIILIVIGFKSQMYHEPEQEKLISANNRTLRHAIVHQQSNSHHSSTKQNNLLGNRKDLTTQVAQEPQQASQQAKVSIFLLKRYQSAFIEPDLLKQIRDIQCERIFQTQAITAPSLQSFVMRKLIDYHKRSLAEILSKVTQDNCSQYLSEFRAHLRKFYVTEHMLMEYFAELTKEEHQKVLKRKVVIEYDRQQLQQQFKAFRFFKEEYKSKNPKIKQQSQQKQSKVTCFSNQIQKLTRKKWRCNQYRKDGLRNFGTFSLGIQNKKTNDYPSNKY